MEKFDQFGTKWAAFRPFFRQRSVNSIKNRWHTLSRRIRLKIPTPSLDSRNLPQRVTPALPDRQESNPLAIYNITNLLNHEHRLIC
jgi:hypothetical protein